MSHIYAKGVNCARCYQLLVVWFSHGGLLLFSSCGTHQGLGNFSRILKTHQTYKNHCKLHMNLKGMGKTALEVRISSQNQVQYPTQAMKKERFPERTLNL